MDDRVYVTAVVVVPVALRRPLRAVATVVLLVLVLRASGVVPSYPLLVCDVLRALLAALVLRELVPRRRYKKKVAARLLVVVLV